MRTFSGARPDLRTESKCEENLTRTVLKLFENESRLFPGTDSRSWAMHLQTFIELAKTHEVRNSETLLQLIRWDLGPGAKMGWDEFKSEPNHAWMGFLRLM